MTQLQKNRPKNYQSLKEVVSCIRDFQEGTRFRISTIDGHYNASFVKYKNKVLYYTINSVNPVIDNEKIRRVLLHRIKFIM